VDNTTNSTNAAVQLTGKGSLTTSGPGLFSFPQVVTLAGQLQAKGPIHGGMSTNLPTKPKLAAGGSLTIGGQPADAMSPVITLPGIEDNGTIDATSGNLAVTPANGSTDPVTLSGTGTVITGEGAYVGSNIPSFTPSTITVDTDGIIAPGGSDGTGALTIQGQIDFKAGSTLAVSLQNPAANATTNQVASSDAVTIESGANLSITVPAALGPKTYPILSGTSITGSFATINGEALIGNSFNVGGIPFRINYDLSNPDSQSVSLTRVATPNIPANFEGTGTSDLAVYLPQYGDFAIRPASGPDKIIPFGAAGTGQSIPAPGDYDGSGQTELGVYLPAYGVYAYRPASGTGDVVEPFGVAGDGQSIPVPGDYDGNGHSDMAIYLPSFGAFAIRDPGLPDRIVPFGFSGDGQTIPAPGDYFGTGQTDIAAYLPSVGAFAIRNPAGGADEIIPFGLSGSGQTIPMPGDYDGSGKTEIAAYFPSLGVFAYRPANGGPDVIESFGIAGAGQSLPAPGDYDGDGKTDLAIYVQQYGDFAIRPSGGGDDEITPFGIPSTGASIPVTGIYSSTTEISAASVKLSKESLAATPQGSTATSQAVRSFSEAAIRLTTVGSPRKSLVAVAQADDDGSKSSAT
jgi:hypothetical protein